MVTQLNDGSTKPFMCVCGNIDTSAICVLAQFIGETTNSKIFRRTLASQYWHHNIDITFWVLPVSLGYLQQFWFCSRKQE